ncbi:MAG: adenylate/guanylate cyclase domain-containing protein [Gemmatimonadota bacterium]
MNLGSLGVEAERRVITVMFADLSGFTPLTERLDAEEVHALIASFLHPLCDCVTRWGGFVDKFIGDCVMSLFGAPLAYENEPERAVRAALDMHAALHRWAEEGGPGGAKIDPSSLQLSIGINTGPVVTGLFSGGGARDYTAIGDTVNVASRLQGVCAPGQILVGPDTYEQTKHVFEYGGAQLLRVKGRREPVGARYVVGLRAERGEVRGFRGRRIPLVGRARELEELRERWRSASQGRFELCVLSGAPGIGKSRLLEELVRVEGLEPEEVATSRCYPYARSTPWEPVAELIRDLHGLPPDCPAAEAAAAIVHGTPGDWLPDDAAVLAVVLGGSAEGVPRLEDQGPEERLASLAGAVARALGTSEAGPRLLIAEDLHWADRTTLEFLHRVPDLEIPGPMLMVLVTRPPVPGERLIARLLDRIEARVELGPLPQEVSRELIDALLGFHRLPDELVRLIVERGDGNPLFIEEILKSLVERGDLRLEGGVWRTSLDGRSLGAQVPDSIETLMSTRIDQLDQSTKRVLQYAAIVGRRFWSGVVADVMARKPVDRELDDLVESHFVRPESDSLVSGDKEFMFEHLLLQEVAYDGLLRGLRAQLHGAVAAWLEEHLADRSPEYDDWVAYHHERSKEPGRALPFLERAAARASARGALLDAASLAERALAVAPGPQEQLRLLGLVEEIAAVMGDEKRREEAIEELEALARLHGDEAIGAEAGYRRARRLLATGELARARAVAEEAMATFEGLKNIDRQGDCAALLGRVAHLWGEYPEALARYRSALPPQREVGDRQGEAEILDRLGLVEIDRGDFTRALDYFETAAELFRLLGNRPMESRVLAHRATAVRWLGLLEEAEALAGEAGAIARSCGSRRAGASAELTLGIVLVAMGRREEATAILAEVCRRAEELRRPGLAARAWLALGELESGEEGLRCLARAREAARGAGLVHIAILAASREAELALESGDTAAADRASREAIEGLRRHGNIQGPEEEVLYTRARALLALGRDGEGRDLLREAREAIHHKAGLIEDPELRRRFLDEVTMNRQILGAPSQAAR